MSMQQQPTRRTVIAGTMAGSALVALGCKSAAQTSRSGPMEAGVAEPAPSFAAPVVARALPHELPPLPYAENALEPYLSARTLGFHYGKHHRAYVDNTNAALKDAPDLAALPLEELIRKVAGDSSKAGLFNNAAQVFNHSFYWKSMSPKGGGAPPAGKLLDRINASFGGYEKFKEAFATAGKTQFGSGWAWLVADGDALSVVKTPNAETPMAQGKRCLITMDVWEHAYYLDYQNQRPNYVTAFLDHLVNWEFAAANLG